MKGMKEEYRQTVEYLFGKSYANYINIAKYNECQSKMDDLVTNWTAPINNFRNNLSVLYLNETCWNGKLNALYDLEVFLNSTICNYLQSEGSFAACHWYCTSGNTRDDQAYGLFLDYADATKKIHG